MLFEGSRFNPVTIIILSQNNPVWQYGTLKKLKWLRFKKEAGNFVLTFYRQQEGTLGYIFRTVYIRY